MRSRISIFLLGLALIATMCFTGCALGGDDDDDNNVVDTGGSTTISGSVTTDSSSSLREGLRAVSANSATLGFYYLNNAGEQVAIRTGIPVTFIGTSANYSFGVTIPTEALQKRNFLLIAVTDTNETIEGVVPFNPSTETTVTVPPIDPNHAGPVALAKAAAAAGVPNIDMGNALSIYTPAEIKAMINTANMTTLLTRLQEREQAMTQLKTDFAEHAAKIQLLMDYSFQLARNPDYMGFANREKFEEAMQAKAVELGLPVDAMSAIDTMEGEFIGSGLPPKTGVDFDKLSQATEQKRELEMLGNAMTYFAGLLNKSELNEIKAKFVTAADTFFTQTMAGTPIQPAANPFFILDEARKLIFEALGGDNDVVNASILVKEADMQGIAIGEMPTPEQIIEHKKALFALVTTRITAQYANLVGAPTDATEKAKFIQALAALASIPMAPQ
ncbi:MAG: hypothetical protein CVV42_04575 [Candidatus Riflebacteria bacterium HGW-Riflebacteria-2]|jgi:hypothetical protein|nr:MAG: hypothetical protein CVV42_04575 [Candidatus Riflebacteria bacterium HGW-Riflebacteria-2]